MPDSPIVCLGGKAHLHVVQSSPPNEPRTFIQGDDYWLTKLPEFGNRTFYVQNSLLLKTPHDILFNYLLAIFPNINDRILLRFARTTARTLTFRLSHQAWLYLDVRKIFTNEFVFDSAQADFKRMLVKHIYTVISPEIRHNILLAFNQHFPNAFFVPDDRNDKKTNLRLMRSIKPLESGVFNDLYNALRPKSMAEMELLAVALSYYCNSNSYLFSTAEGKNRVNVYGKPGEAPTPEQRRYALKVLDSRNYDVPIRVRAKVEALTADRKSTIQEPAEA